MVYIIFGPQFFSSFCKFRKKNRTPNINQKKYLFSHITIISYLCAKLQRYGNYRKSKVQV